MLSFRVASIAMIPGPAEKLAKVRQNTSRVGSDQ
jgi:hypothetical protein